MSDHEPQGSPRPSWLPIVLVLVPVALALFVWSSVLVRRQHDLDTAIGKAAAEEKRLLYVLKRNDELQATRAALRAQAGMAGTAAPSAPMPEAPDPPARHVVRIPWGAAEAIHERQEDLDALTQYIQKGVRIEKNLPELEREIQALQAQVAAASAASR